MSEISTILQSWEFPRLSRCPRQSLYSALVTASRVVSLCDDPAELTSLNNEILSRPHLGNRTYIEASSDIFVRVCRFMFCDDTRANISRYAVALRNAGEAGINTNDLYAALAVGGINKFTNYNRPIKSCPHCGATL